MFLLFPLTKGSPNTTSFIIIFCPQRPPLAGSPASSDDDGAPNSESPLSKAGSPSIHGGRIGDGGGDDDEKVEEEDEEEEDGGKDGAKKKGNVGVRRSEKPPYSYIAIASSSSDEG